ncbi:hypothetical protein L0Z13_06905 [Burkholderia multivorans]|uniref:hypothetical protein n=1 Tax=Burkholderia multivorans TaxID=87883 RepID=UPI000277C6F7|nr:hypothetical protein [Burkholderia multivorans]AVR22833.1 hypothetical protein A8H40_26475 [Burkholderia multivorans]EJO63245.1 hypothetical protein BURMUCF1_2382 [Burkholderia multivorans ATCC BAA-247]MBU9495869.1 hypothetical protein [Burkholderia multivorans]MCO1436287.1 hypothetical protein [Burkholderia multivorans]MDN7508940.1 hypothetical protein [Burkholderia multivorans]
MDKSAHIQTDRRTIERLGGPAKVAELLGYEKHLGGTQRVCNWLVRGIPAAVKVERPDLFMANLVAANSQDQAR